MGRIKCWIKVNKAEIFIMAMKKYKIERKEGLFNLRIIIEKMNRKIEICILHFYKILYKFYVKKKREFEYWKYLWFPLGKKIFLLGTPTHHNIGDSAIVIAEIEFIKKLGFRDNQIKELTVEEVKENPKNVIRCITNHKKSIVCWHGGGNLGNVWSAEEYFRREMIGKINNKMIIFPQTIYYTDDKIGQSEKDKSIPFYNNKNNLTIVAREKVSYDIMKCIYPNTEILLTPDIVLSTGMHTYGIKEGSRKGILLCFRNDIEKKLTEKEEEEIIGLIKYLGYKYRKTDMNTRRNITKENRWECVREKMEEFSNAELVITDRLHGMIFSTITQTPCIVFDNNNHKIYGTYQWLENLSFVHHTKNIEDISECIKKMLSQESYEIRTMQGYFEVLKEKFEKR